MESSKMERGVMSAFVASLDDEMLESRNHTQALALWMRHRCKNPEKAKNIPLDRIQHYLPSSLSSFIRSLFDEKTARMERKNARKRKAA